MNDHQKPIWAINLKKAREISGMTQREIADQIFKSSRMYAFYEEGEYEPPMETWKLIWELFKVIDPLKFWTEEYYELTAGEMIVTKDQAPLCKKRLEEIMNKR